MKPGALVSIGVVVIAAAACTVWIGWYAVGSSANVVPTNDSSSEDDQRPQIAETGPHPKIVLPETEYDFGAMNVDEEQSHAFVVSNEGEAPLELVKGGTTCKCTLSKLEDGTLAPGESMEIELTWHPKSLAREFSQYATVYTNDPNNEEIRFKVTGRVVDEFQLVPRNSIDLGVVAEDQPLKADVKLFSETRDDFEVTAVRTPDYLEHEVEPFDDELLERFRAKKGFRIRLSLAEEDQAGELTGNVEIDTDLDDGRTFRLPLRGRRSGPLQVVPIDDDIVYHQQAMAVEMGRFPASEGKSATLGLFVKGVGEEGFELLDVETDPDFVQVEMREVETFRVPNKRRYNITFTIPAGTPPLTRLGKNSAKIRLKTNHERLEKLKFYLTFVAE